MNPNTKIKLSIHNMIDSILKKRILNGKNLTLGMTNQKGSTL